MNMMGNPISSDKMHALRPYGGALIALRQHSVTCPSPSAPRCHGFPPYLPIGHLMVSTSFDQPSTMHLKNHVPYFFYIYTNQALQTHEILCSPDECGVLEVQQ